ECRARVLPIAARGITRCADLESSARERQGRGGFIRNYRGQPEGTGGTGMIEILLVDDESYVTESLAMTIPWQELGVSKVYQAASPNEALAIMEQQAIDIMVTDIRMPEMSGLQLIETVRERWPNIRYMLLTGH